MRLFSRGCAHGQLPYIASAGGLSLGERLDLEAHAATCLECAEALRDAVAIHTALRRAFAPLRARRALLAPGRARLAQATRPATRKSAWLRAPAVFARLAEVSVALGVALFAVTSSIEPPQSVTLEPRSVIHDYFRSRPPAGEIEYFRWLRLQPALPADQPEAVRMPAGGRFDVEPAEIVTARTASPR